MASGIVALSGLGGFALGAAVADGDDELRPLGNRAEDGAVPRGPRGFADGRSGPPHGHGFDHDFDRGTPPDGDDPSTTRDTDSGSDDADAGSLT